MSEIEDLAKPQRVIVRDGEVKVIHERKNAWTDIFGQGCILGKYKHVITIQPTKDDDKIIEGLQNTVFGEEPVELTCPVCKKQVTTVTDDAAGLITCLTCSAICLLGGCFGCCLIPFCVHKLMNVEHSCPNCEAYIGIYRRDLGSSPPTDAKKGDKIEDEKHSGDAKDEQVIEDK